MFDHVHAADLAKIGARRVGKYEVPFVYMVSNSVLCFKISLTREIRRHVTMYVP